MRVLIADLFSEAGIAGLVAQNIDVTYDAQLNGDSLTEALKNLKPNVLVVRSTKVTKEMIDAGTSIQLIVRAGAGTDTIDVAHAAKRGIYVANCPGKNAHAVAELTMAFVLSIDRRTAEGNALLKEGKWHKAMFINCTGVKGKTIGLIGFGSIAQLVLARAKAFEMEVLVHTRTQVAGLEKKLGFRYVSQDELLAQSDIVSLHTPATPQTKGMVNKEFLSKMKPDALLINTSRGTCVVDDALMAHLEANPDFWVGTDVFSGEPATGKLQDWANAMAQHPRVYGTHHIGASTKQAEDAIGEEACRVIKKFVGEGKVDNENCVNRADKDVNLHKLSIRHLDKVGVLAHCFSVFAKHGWNVQELENIVFKEREACVVNLVFQGESGNREELMAELNANENVLDVQF